MLQSSNYIYIWVLMQMHAEFMRQYTVPACGSTEVIESNSIQYIEKCIKVAVSIASFEVELFTEHVIAHYEFALSVNTVVLYLPKISWIRSSSFCPAENDQLQFIQVLTYYFL